MTTCGAERRRRRRAFTLVELAMSVFLLMAAMGITVRVLAWVGGDRRAADRRMWAVQEVANVMERVGGEPFERVTKARARELADESGAARLLPGSSWEVAVDDEPEAPVPARRVSLRLRWKDRSGDWDAPVRLTSWVYRRGAPR